MHATVAVTFLTTPHVALLILFPTFTDTIEPILGYIVFNTACLQECLSDGFLLGLPDTLHVDAHANTKCGPIVGNRTTEGYLFAGIPYALPPKGCLRWKPPIALDPAKGPCWNGTLNAKSFGNMCYQRSIFNAAVHNGDENCLFINVWTPTLNTTANLPVMVWIHGGSLVTGSGSYPGYAPTTKVAKDTQMVYVSMNYRLSAFGFMALDVLSSDSKTGTSGNYGIMDQIVALEWVRDNVNNFGGDPSSVTVFGQSSGGTSVFALLVSPMANGLFHRAWMMSASPILNKTLADASTDNLVFQNNTGCRTALCLYQLTADKVLDAIPWDVYPNWAGEDNLDLPSKGHYNGALLIVDGVVVPEPPFEAWKAGRGVDVPLMIGTTAQEIDMLPLPQNISKWNWSNYLTHVREKMEPFGEPVLKGVLNFYPVGEVTPEYQYTSMASDIRTNCGNDILAKHAADRFTNPVYRYVIDYYPSMPIHVIAPFLPASSFAFHLWDFYAFMGFIGDHIKRPTHGDLAYQEVVQNEITAFCMTGRVNSTSWTPVPFSTAIIMDRHFVSGTTYHDAECDFFNEYDLLSYSWLN